MSRELRSYHNESIKERLSSILAFMTFVYCSVIFLGKFRVISILTIKKFFQTDDYKIQLER